MEKDEGQFWPCFVVIKVNLYAYILNQRSESIYLYTNQHVLTHLTYMIRSCFCVQTVNLDAFYSSVYR